jgi:cysteine desulfurase / selenocysteine lyase
MKSIDEIRLEFEPLSHDSIYLDSGASALTPNSVLDSMNQYYTEYRSNIHRGLYDFSERATLEYEGSRDIIAQFIGANRAEEVIFTSGTTDGVNILSELLQDRFEEGQNIIIPVTEHHSNMLPWRELARRQQLEIRYIGLKGGILDEAALLSAIDENTALVAIGHISNVLGTIHNVKKISDKAHTVGALCIVDGAQAVSHIPVSVSDLGIDAYVFSGHKLYGPTGIGVLWVNYTLLQDLNPRRTGGDMVAYVSLETLEYATIPQRFEAGTPPIAEVIGLARAIQWIQDIGWEQVQEHEKELIQCMWQQILSRPWIELLGGDKSVSRIGCFAFTIEGIHTHDIAYLLAKQHICVRAGQHCASGITEKLGIVGSIRVTFGIYNIIGEIDILMRELDTIYHKFQ